MTTLVDLLTWRESLESGEAIAAAVTAANAAAPSIHLGLASAERIIVTGAGSSYYLAQTVAAAGRAIIGRPVFAAPLSELILRPEGVLSGRFHSPREPVVIISRSGSTSEAVTVAARMRAAGHLTVAVTCRPTSPLAAAADIALVSPLGDESAIVMTRSFASMLALLLVVVARIGGGSALLGDLETLADHWSEATKAAATGRRLGATDWSRVVVLGGGPAFGIASEWCLKLTETSQVPAIAYEPLEFRHGPISVCEPGMLVVGLVGGAGAAEEIAVLRESASLGAETWLIAQSADEIGIATSEVSLIGGGLHPVARLPLLIHPAHALALTLALTRGRDPDAPRHLGQVVILDPE
jgi:glucosamine--fructose-6-phosphate aminotransferase (isomerizing)